MNESLRAALFSIQASLDDRIYHPVVILDSNEATLCWLNEFGFDYLYGSHIIAVDMSDYVNYKAMIRLEIKAWHIEGEENAN